VVTATAVWLVAAFWTVGVASAGEAASTIRVPQGAASLQAALDAAHPGDTILLGRGMYAGGVTVPFELHDLTIRGVDRNDVVLDGHDAVPNGIEVHADGVTIENMTAHDFVGNAFYWDGVDRFAGRYLTVYNVGSYGIYGTGGRDGVFEHDFVSGAADAAFYIGECRPCDATLRYDVARLSAVGYSGTNAGGNVVVEDSTWDRNGTGILPNSYDVGLAPPPQDGATFRRNVVRDSGTVAVPVTTPLAGFRGIGIGIAGGHHDLVEDNEVTGSAAYGIAVYSTVKPDQFWPPSSNTISGNTVRGSGTADLALAAGGGSGNCFQGNDVDTALPPSLDVATCVPVAGSARVRRDLLLSPDAARARIPDLGNGPWYNDMPRPGPQSTMPLAADSRGDHGPWSAGALVAAVAILGLGALTLLALRWRGAR